MADTERRRLPFAGRVALITGSTSGIGLGLAEAFAGAGAAVMLHGLGEAAEIKELQRRLAATHGVDVSFHDADARDGEAMERLVEIVVQRFGRIDFLINNAGVQHVAPVQDFSVERWRAIQDIVLNASFHTIRAAVPHLIECGSGRILQVASAHALVASPFKSAYVAAKHAQLGLTKCVALELAEKGVTCNAICPGYVRTPLVEGQIRNQARNHGISEEQVVRDVMLASQPTRRFVEVAEIAALALFLCGDLAGSITGCAIPIDGGWTAR